MIVGGGPAGATAALLLARAGRPVTVIERTPAPSHRICGEFLGGDALRLLAAIGVDVGRLGASPIDRMRFIRGSRVVETALPFPAAGVSRLALDAALLDLSVAAGASVFRGRRARSVDETTGTVVVEGLGALRPAATFLATGKHELRGVGRRLGGAADPKVGLKTHLRLAPAQAAALRGSVELMLFPDAYAGLQMVTAEVANLCMVVAESRLARAGSWPGLLADLARACPPLERRLCESRGWEKPLAIARTPYGFVHAAQPGDTPMFRLGDQMGVIPSFAGDGIAMALRTATLAAGTLLADGTARDYHARARRSIRRPIRLATMLYRAGHVAAGQASMMAAARAWPGLLRGAAALTRAG